MLTVVKYAEHVGKTPRTIARWIADGELPQAVQGEGGRWLIPETATRQIHGGAKRANRERSIVERTLTQLVSAAPPAPAALETLEAARPDDRTLSLEEAMVRYAVGPHGLELLAKHGILIIDRFGRRGAKRVYVLR